MASDRSKPTLLGGELDRRAGLGAEGPGSAAALVPRVAEHILRLVSLTALRAR
jgi:hypothetical protein